jgi:hypothetical protein
MPTTTSMPTTDPMRNGRAAALRRGDSKISNIAVTGTVLIAAARPTGSRSPTAPSKARPLETHRPVRPGLEHSRILRPDRLERLTRRLCPTRRPPRPTPYTGSTSIPDGVAKSASRTCLRAEPASHACRQRSRPALTRNTRLLRGFPNSQCESAWPIAVYHETSGRRQRSDARANKRGLRLTNLLTPSTTKLCRPVLQ